MSEPTATPAPTPPSTPKPSRTPRRWPLALLALPAAVAVWGGWVGLGEKTGFGVINLLPGIADLKINTAIALPIGVEAYAAYALAAWLTSAPVNPAARAFAKWSALLSLALGMAGQVAYHLLESAGHRTAPAWVTTVVSCLPVLVLGMGAALAHLLARPSSRAEDRTGMRAEDAGPDKRQFVETLRREILAAAEAGERWGPDYASLMERTGRSRSWCEKRVREARALVFAAGGRA